MTGLIGMRARRRMHLRRTPLLAGAAVLTLLVALFASSAPTQAAEGDLSATSGWCVRENNNYRVTTTHNSTGDPQLSYHKVRNANNEWVNINCPSELAGLRVNLEPNGTVNPKITIRDPWLDLWLSETYVQPGTTVSLTMVIRDAVDVYSDYGSGSLSSWDFLTYSYLYAASMPDATLNGEQVSLRVDYLHTSGVLSNPIWPDGNLPRTDISDTSGPALKNPDGRFTWTIPVPHGTTPGEYIVSASFTWDEYSGDGWPGLPGNPLRLRTVKDEVVLHVVEEFPNFVAEASIELGTARGEDDRTLATEFLAEDGTEPADGGDIFVRIKTLDADGEAPEDKRITQIQVFAEGGAANGGVGGNTIVGNDARATTGVRITKPDKQAGTVEVYAIVIGQGGIAETERLTLTFTGAPAELMLGGDLRVGQPAAGEMSQAELALSATDAAGNDVPPGAVVYSVTDADGNAVSPNLVDVETSTAGVTTMTSRDDSEAPIALVSVSAAAEPGAYTITASLPNVDDSADTAVVSVAGPTANLELSADPASATMVSEVITVTAMVTDAAGVAVADGESVTFTLTGGPLVLVGQDADSAVGGHQSLTKDGAASATFVVIGSGAAVIAASSGGQSSVIVVSSNTTMSEPAAEEAEAPSAVDCTRGLVGFVTWNCSQSSTAAAVLAELAQRGVTAIYLYETEGEDDSEGTWTSYAMVDGMTIPGSVDFTIRQGDILYISR